MSNRLLDIRNLKTYFYIDHGVVTAVDDVSFYVNEGETLGIVGESGCGKSVSCMSIVRLIDTPPGKYEGGEIWFNGEDMLKVSDARMRQIRGNDISFIFQEPMTSLNPVFKVKRQIGESYMIHQGMGRKQAHAAAVRILGDVQIPNPEKVAEQYPFQLSGGMRQRVMIAMALACRPKVLIADEPTTALDVTIQAQILRLMNDLKSEIDTSILFITHDLGVINEMADDVAVMYCGQVVETAPVRMIFGKGIYSHPYTEGLLTSIPHLGTPHGVRLEPIAGSVPHPLDLPVGCRFAPRCKYCQNKCEERTPDLLPLKNGQSVRCYYPDIGERRNMIDKGKGR